MSGLVSIAEAAARGVERVRRPQWAIPLDHLRLCAQGGKPGPWLLLYSPFNEECNGMDPVPIPASLMDLGEAAYEGYEGPLPDSVEYEAARAAFGGALEEK